MRESVGIVVSDKNENHGPASLLFSHSLELHCLSGLNSREATCNCDLKARLLSAR